MITVKEYANKRETTPQAVYKLLKKHSKELEGHISKVNGVKVIDEEGERFLDNIDQKNSAVVVNQGQAQRIIELEEALKQAKDKIIYLQDQMDTKSNMIIALQQQNNLLIEEKNKKWWQKIFK